MSIVLLILKIVGCILLILLTLLLLLAFAVVFVPVRYHIAAKSDENVEMDFRLHWLCCLIYFRLESVNGENRAAIRFLGIKKQIYPVKEKKKKQKKNPDDEAVNKQALEEPMFTAQEIKPDYQEKSTDFTEAEIIQEKTQDNKKKTAFSKIKRLGKFFKAIPEKIKNARTKLAAGWQILADEANKRTAKLVLKELRYLWSHYRPRKLFADIRYCMGNPAYTGKTLAILSMIPFLFQEKVQIVPDFESEQPYFKGVLKAKGHIRSFHLIHSGLHIWRDKNIKKLIRKMKQ